MTSIDGKSIVQELFSTIQVFPKVICDIVTQYAERLYFKLNDTEPGYLAHSGRFLFKSSLGQISVYSSELNWQLVTVVHHTQWRDFTGMWPYKKKKLILTDHFFGNLFVLDICDDNPNNWRFDSFFDQSLLHMNPTDCHVNGDILYVSDPFTHAILLFVITLDDKSNLLQFTRFGKVYNEHLFFKPTAVRTFMMPNGSIRGFIGHRHGAQVFEQKSETTFSQALCSYQQVNFMAVWKNLLFLVDHHKSITVLDMLTFEVRDIWGGTLNGLSWESVNGIDVTDNFLCISDKMMECVHLIPHSLGD
jgi:hypothetical protein